MNVLIISIGTELLRNDILDHNAALATRRLHESGINLVARATVGDDLDSIVATLRITMEWIDTILTIGGLGTEDHDLTRQAVAKVTGRVLLDGMSPAIAGAVALGGSVVQRQGLMLQESDSTLICLPGKPQDMAYLLETEVIPFLQRLDKEEVLFGSLLLRTAGAMESNLEEQLADLNIGDSQRVSFSSYAGQTDIVLWVEGETQNQVDAHLIEFEATVSERLGDQIYGREGDRLENVLLDQLNRNQVQLAVAECYTNGILNQLLTSTTENDQVVTISPTGSAADLAGYLVINTLTDESDLTRWCRLAAERLREKTGRDAALLVYNHVTPGGVQVLVTLATSQGVSIMQRSFGGHPVNIDLWAATLAMAHLRRWLLAHSPSLDEQP